jgi:hypothetical protein
MGAPVVAKGINLALATAEIKHRVGASTADTLVYQDADIWDNQQHRFGRAGQ